MQKQIFEYFIKDNQTMNSQVKSEIAKLNTDINRWGTQGNFRKDYCLREIEKRKVEISKQYKQKCIEEAEKLKQQALIKKEYYERDLKSNPAYYQLKADQAKARYEMMSDKGLSAALTKFMDAEPGDSVMAFPSYEDMYTAIREARSRKGGVSKLGDAAAEVARNSQLEPYNYAYKETVALNEAANEVRNSPTGRVRINVVNEDGEASEMSAPLDQLIDTAPLGILA